ncbi:MAG: lactate utilization protein [Proteobacteria bacterium]|nr:lactate utilization protein [Pseudomonadota bacterium]
MSARATIIAGVRRGLGRGPVEPAKRAELEERLKRPKPNLIPDRSRLDPDGQVWLFLEMAVGAACTVVQAKAEDVPGAVAEYLKSQNLPAELVMAPDPELDRYPWASRTMLAISRGKTDGSDPVSVTGAFAGVAETGTLMLTSGPESPTTLNFLPDTHIVVIPRSKVVGAYEEAWERLRALHRQEDGYTLPRTVNFITGPSRSGDIEQRIQMGAHGPRRLHIVLVED